MSFNFSQYVKDSNAEYITIQTLPNYTATQNKDFIYTGLTLTYGDTYYFVLSGGAENQERMNGGMYFQENSESDKINFFNFQVPILKNTDLEKVITIKEDTTYTILGLYFDKPYTDWQLVMYKVNELEGEGLPIPHSAIKHLGIQGKAGMRYCINGSELIMTSRGVEEFYAFNAQSPITSIKIIPKQSFFLIDYEYDE